MFPQFHLSLNSAAGLFDVPVFSVLIFPFVLGECLCGGGESLSLRGDFFF